MYRYFMMMIPLKRLKDFSFLNQTMVLKKDDYYLFVYFEPLDMLLKDMVLKDIRVIIALEFDLSHYTATEWTVARDYRPTLPSDDTRAFISALDVKYTQSLRQGGHYLPLNRNMIKILTRGLYTQRDVTQFVKMLYIAGYSYFDMLTLFSVVTKDKSETMTKHFISCAGQLYGNGD